MFLILLRLLGEYKQITAIISKIFEAVPELKEMIDLVNLFKNPSAVLHRKLTETLRRLTPDQIRQFQKYLNQLGKHTDFERMFKERVKESYGDKVDANLIDLSNIQISLGSSWLAFGIWVPKYCMPGKSVYGTLEWTTKSGYGPYSEPNVSEETWKAMVLSFNHAGTIGWERGVFNARKKASVIKKRFNVSKRRIRKYGGL